MEPLKTGVLLVDRDFHAFTRRFAVKTTANADIMDLKEKVQEMRPNDLSSFDLPELSVWKMKGDMIIKNLTPKKQSEILDKIDICDKNTIQALNDEENVADIGLSYGETLLLRVPAVVHVSPVGDVIITTDVVPEYKHCFLKAKSEGGFRDGDIEFNDIYDSVIGRAPEFVADHEAILSQKRELAPEMRALAKGMFAEIFFAEYFCLTEELCDSSPIVYRPEVDHLNHISSINARWWKTGFKENDGYWLFFFTVTEYYEALAPPVSHGEPIITISGNESSNPWYFHYLIEVHEELHTYRLKNDFLLLKHGLPRLAVEVNSTQNWPSVDLIRLMLQGASIVRFANTKLDAYKKEKDFVFVAIYIDSQGQVDRYLLYQDEKIDPRNPHNVYRKLRTFQLAEANERMRFALELYNFYSTWHDDEHTKEQVDKLKDAVKEASENLPEFTGGFKHPATETEDTSTKSHQSGNAGGAAGLLKESGYEVVPDVFETDGGTWELIDKLPPHVRTVYRRRDPNKTEYIAKHLREGSNELAIHEYLQSRPSQSPHIVSFIKAVPSTTREWLILPNLHSIARQWFLDENGDAGRVRLGWGPIKGLAYLHEHKIAHRDIKPDNLVRDRNFNLKIIDFDLAIKVEDENTEIKGYLGTEGWTAPEIGKEGDRTPTYSPIKADRWSCGRVILHHIMVGGTVMNADRSLLNFANRLMVKDPQQRLSLLESHVSSVLQNSVSRPRQHMADVDGESMEQRDAKRPRLE